jgi:CIC family chloride channel protein
MDWRKEIETDLHTVKVNDTLGDLVKIIAVSKRNLYPVVDEYNVLEGVVSLDDVREIMLVVEAGSTIALEPGDRLTALDDGTLEILP